MAKLTKLNQGHRNSNYENCLSDEPARHRLTNLVQSSSIKNVLILAWRDLDAIDSGGSELHMHQLAKRLSNAGCRVTVRTSRVQSAPKYLKRDGYEVLRISGRYWSFPRSITAGFLNRFEKYDALIEAWNGMPFLSPLWFKKPKVILLHHIHGVHYWNNVLPVGLSHLGSLFETKIAPLIYKNSHLIVPSQSTAQEVIKKLNWPEYRLTVAYPGVEDCFKPGNFKSQKPLILTVGRLVASKRISWGLHILSQLRKVNDNFEFLIIGDGPERPKLENIIKQLNIGSWCKLLGKVPLTQLIDYYQKAWVVVSFSIKEGWGMTLTEAAACGTPAVATKIAGHKDAVIEGLSGFLANDESEFLSYLTDILTDTSLRQRLSKGAVAHAQNLTWDATAYSIFSALVSSVNRGSVITGCDRRNFKRYPVRIKVDVNGSLGYFLNLSSSGALLKLFSKDSKLAPGESVEIRACFKGLDLRLNALVVREAFEAGYNCLGIKFVDLCDPVGLLKMSL